MSLSRICWQWSWFTTVEKSISFHDTVAETLFMQFGPDWSLCHVSLRAVA